MSGIQWALKSVVAPDSPMLRVTVMMLSDIVESVMLLKDEDWNRERL